MKKITDLILIIAGCMSILATCTVLADCQSRYKAQYAAEHNCRWDYNDLCYTTDEKPWLFK